HHRQENLFSLMFGIAKLCPMTDWLGKAVLTLHSARLGTAHEKMPFPSQGLTDSVKSANMLKISGGRWISNRAGASLWTVQKREGLVPLLRRGHTPRAMACRVPARPQPSH